MNTKNPLASFCLFTYNQKNFIEEAIEAAFSQTYTNLEIIISDDFSTDGTREIISRMVENYSGSHKVIVNYNQKNLGLAQHVNKILYQIVTGEYVFLAAGDDISLPFRVEKTVAFYRAHTDIVATGSNLREINHLSVESNSQKFKIKEHAVYDLNYYLSSFYEHLYGCTRSFAKSVIDAFPPLDANCPTEDTPLLFRAFLINRKVGFLEEIMVKYRIHGDNISSPVNIRKMNVNAIFAQYDRDLKHALQKKFISKEEFRNLKKVLKDRKNIRLGNVSFSNRLRAKCYFILNEIKKSFKRSENFNGQKN